jgi:hypothetical protein
MVEGMKINTRRRGKLSRNIQRIIIELPKEKGH